MASDAGFFFVYGTAIVLLEGLAGLAFALRSFAESSPKMRFFAVAYAWSAPMTVFYLIALPGVPPDLPGEPPQPRKTSARKVPGPRLVRRDDSQVLETRAARLVMDASRRTRKDSAAVCGPAPLRGARRHSRRCRLRGAAIATRTLAIP